jgi:hypothetical protein
LGTNGALAALFKEQLVGEEGNKVLASVKTNLANLYQGFSGTGGGNAESWFDKGLKAANLPKKELFVAGEDTSIAELIKQGIDDLKTNSYSSNWSGALPHQEEYKMYQEALERASGIGLLKGEKTETYRMLALTLKNMYGFATGGVADFTGPAWLDGTPSRPELVLNPDDSRNFLILRDALSSLTNGNVTASSTGDNYYDINIDATLANDYDTEQLGRKIKNMIVDDAMYRNVTAVNRLR